MHGGQLRSVDGVKRAEDVQLAVFIRRGIAQDRYLNIHLCLNEAMNLPNCHAIFWDRSARLSPECLPPVGLARTIETNASGGQDILRRPEVGAPFLLPSG